MPQRAYWSIPICDNGEPLLQIPIQDFAAAPIHDYQRLGAPYGGHSPYAVRAGVLEGLYQAQAQLQLHHPQWRLYLFDAYRPLAVQQFMANHAYESLMNQRALDANCLTSAQVDELWQEVYKIWAPPNDNPLTPPPHSTGGAVDLSIFDLECQECIDMGSPIDEMSERSQPNYFAELLLDIDDSDLVKGAQLAMRNRNILLDVMEHAGFQRHPGEWWHFCLGDQMWAWLTRSDNSDTLGACYGRYDLLELA